MYRVVKEWLDFAGSLTLLFLLAPILAAIGIMIKLDSKGEVLFRQERIGKDFRSFHIYKFRTMYSDSEGPQITLPDDPRVTRMGHWLRKYKIDEWPQLINILMGEMSFIGPRPEMKVYVMKYGERYRKILSVKPGLSDPASLAFRNETDMLRKLPRGEAEDNYVQKLLPLKMAMNEEYVDRMSFTRDMILFLRSILIIFSKSS